MIDKRLQYDRQMYAMGQRVAKSLDGSRPGYRGYGAAQDSGSATNSAASAAAGSSGTSGPNNDGTGDFSTPEQTANHNAAQAARAEAIANPSVFSKIGTGIKDYVMGGGLLGMGIRGLTNLFGGPTTKDTTAPDQRNMFNVSGPVVGPPAPREGGDGQGIMAAYLPNMLNVSGEVEEEVPVSKEEEDFIQRYRVANEFRQDKKGQLDPAILEMISKLYT